MLHCTIKDRERLAKVKEGRPNDRVARTGVARDGGGLRAEQGRKLALQ